MRKARRRPVSRNVDFSSFSVEWRDQRRVNKYAPVCKPTQTQPGGDFLFGKSCNTIPVMKSSVISASPDVMGGTPVFAGTRVPVQTFVECIAGGDSIDDFLDGFPSVRREQLIEFLKEAEQYILAAAR
jgi:uncharacterized protein (DUF433 family)